MFRFLPILLILLVVTGVQAEPVKGLYQVRVPVEDESTQARNDAFNKGLEEVMIRVSGDSVIMEKVDLPPVSRYVSQFSYRPLDPPEQGDQGEVYSHLITIQYNGKLVEDYLRGKGQPVWGEHRFDTIIWLAVNDGRNRYVLKSTDSSAIKKVFNEAMQRRGVPDKWPRYDKTDRGRLDMADIRGGFDQSLNAASKRYGNGPILAVTLDWNGKTWQSNWNLLMNNEEKHWNLENTDYHWLLNRGIDRAADAMGADYAISDVTDNAKLASVNLDFLSVDNVSKFHKVEKYLSGLRAVYSLMPVLVEKDHVLFRVRLRSSVDDFINIMKSSSAFAEVEREQPEPLSIVPEKPNQENTNQEKPDFPDKPPGAADTGATSPDAPVAEAPATVQSQGAKTVKSATHIDYQFRLI